MKKYPKITKEDLTQGLKRCKEEQKMTKHDLALREIICQYKYSPSWNNTRPKGCNKKCLGAEWCNKVVQQINDLHKSDIVLDEGKIRIISNDILKNFPITEDMDVLNMRGIDYIRLLDKLAHAIAQSGNALVKEKGVGG